MWGESVAVDNPVQIRLRQARGWSTARAVTKAGTSLIGTVSIPVLRVFHGAEFDRSTGIYWAPKYQIDPDDVPQWWEDRRRRTWRRGIAGGRLVSVRQGRDNGSRNGTVGDWVGIWRVVDAAFRSDDMRVIVETPPVAEATP